MKCKNCEVDLEEDALYCYHCGTKQEKVRQEEKNFRWEENEQAEAELGEVSVEPALEEVKKSKKIPLLAAGTVAALVAAMAAVNFMGHKESVDLFYVRENGFYSADLSSKDKIPVEYTDRLVKTGEESSDFLPFGFVRDSQPLSTVSEDGNYIFYYENLSDTATLHYRNVKNGESRKIDGDVVEYKVTGDNKVVYTTGNKSLYVSNLESKKRLAMGVSAFYLDEQGKNLIWTEGDFDNDCSIYFQDLSWQSPKKELAHNAKLFPPSKDLSRIYYLKDSKMYVSRNQKSGNILAGNVSRVYGLQPETEELYYLQQEKKDEDSYYNLYHYAKEESSLVAEHVDSYPRYISEDDSNFFIIYYSPVAPGSNVSRCYIAKDGEATKLDVSGLYSFYYSQKEKILYSVTYPQEQPLWLVDEGQDLVAIDCGGESLGKVEVVDENVPEIEAFDQTELYYLKNVMDNHGDLYQKRNKVASGVATGTVAAIPDSDSIIYLENADPVTGSGTLVMVTGETKKVIEENVAYYDAVSEDTIILLADYNRDVNAGELKLYDGKKCITVDTDVVNMVPRGQSRGFDYFID